MGKLLKYEFRNSKKPIMQIVIVMVIASLITQLGFFVNIAATSSEYFSENQYNTTNNAPVLSGIITIVAIVSIFVIFGASVAYLLKIANILKDDIYENKGYTIFSLPKTGYQIIGAKLIVAIIWMIVLPLIMFVWNALLFTGLSYAFSQNEIIVRVYENFIKGFLLELSEKLKPSYILVQLLEWFVGAVFTILAVYSSIIFDYRVGSRKGNTLMWIIYYLIFTTIISYVIGLIIPVQEIPDTFFDFDMGISSISIMLNQSITSILMSSSFRAALSVLLFIYVAHNFENKIEK